LCSFLPFSINKINITSCISWIDYFQRSYFRYGILEIRSYS
jgi:hypothetical protein